MFKTVMEDKKFIEDYVKRMAVVPAFMGNAEFTRFMNEQTKVYETFLRESGVIK
jgi:tripartite-type tricarboxylate transporter receptor subunit TctC